MKNTNIIGILIAGLLLVVVAIHFANNPADVALLADLATPQPKVYTCRDLKTGEIDAQIPADEMKPEWFATCKVEGQ